MQVTRSKAPSIGSVKARCAALRAHVGVYVRDRVVRDVDAFGADAAIPERFDRAARWRTPRRVRSPVETRG